jgi:hypothetical protein
VKRAFVKFVPPNPPGTGFAAPVPGESPLIQRGRLEYFQPALRSRGIFAGWRETLGRAAFRLEDRIMKLVLGPCGRPRRIWRLAFGVLCLTGAFAPNGAAQPGEWKVTATEARGRILVPVFLNNAGPYPFVLDAGLQHPAIDAQLAQDLALPASQAAAGMGLQAVEVSVFQFAGIPPLGQTCGVLDLSPLAARLGVAVAGILPAYQPGLEITIGFDPPSVSWRNLDHATAVAADANTVEMKLDSSGAPMIPMVLNTKFLRKVQVDLAFNGMVGLSARALTELNALQPDTPRLVTPLAGEQPETQVRLAEMRVAEAVVNAPVCTVLKDTESPRLGLRFLRHFDVTMNFEHGLIRLSAKGGASFTDPPLVRYGVALDYVMEGLWHISVAEGSPAAAAGFQTGDALLEIDGESLAGVAYPGIARLLSPLEGKSATLAVERNGERITASVNAEKLL